MQIIVNFFLILVLFLNKLKWFEREIEFSRSFFAYISVLTEILHI